MNDKTPPTKYLLCNGKIVEYKDLHLHPDAHIMGHVGYAVSYGERVTVFKRWRMSPSAGEVPPLEVCVDSVIMDSREMCCLHPGCDRKQDWYMSRAAAVALFVKRYGMSEEALNAEPKDKVLKAEDEEG